jgi:DNA polymerase I
VHGRTDALGRFTSFYNPATGKVVELMNVLLVDLSPLLYAVFNTNQIRFKTKAGEPTGLRFGVLRSIRHYEKEVKADRTVIVLDAHHVTPAGDDAVKLSMKVAASGQAATYKANRTPSPELWKMVPDVMTMLELTHWTQAQAPGFEADDVLGTLARRFASQGHQIFIATNDGDMDQLVSESISIFDIRDKFVKRAKEISEKYSGLKPEYILAYRALVGDVSDNIKGIMASGAAKIHLMKWINRHPDIDRMGITFDRDVEITFGKVVGEAFRSNLELMTLHEPSNIVITKGRANEAQLMALFERLEFKSLLPRVKEFTGQVLT